MKLDAHVFTALPIAASRAVASRRPDALLHDPLAHKLFSVQGGGNPDLVRQASANTEYMTKRCLIGDQLVIKQYTENGVRQVVSLGAGLDARACRLDLPGTTFYEVDKEDLFTFKEPLVQDLPLTCAHRRTIVGTLGEVDLGNALMQAGFDPQQPTTWLLEGLLPYLTRSVLESVAQEIGQISAPGSALWGDSFSHTSVDQGIVFHGVPFASGCDDYDVIFRRVGFDQSIVLDFAGITLADKDLSGQRVHMD
jgi:methyltransferase (TIGR00027 family)